MNKYSIKRISEFLIWLSIFYDIFKGRGKSTYDKKHVKYVMERFKYEFNANLFNLNEAEECINFIASSLKKIKIRDCRVVRIGPEKDSGYVIANLFDKPSIISGGAGKNIDFEISLAKQGSKVIIFDPTVKTLPASHENIEHMKIALEGEPSGEFSNSTALGNLELSRFENGHYLKLDIEGSEWKLIEKLGDGIQIYDQLIIEFHNLYMLSNEQFRQTAKNVISTLCEHFKLINFHPNNWRTFVCFGKAGIPEVFEATFIRNDHVQFDCKANEFLNFANNPYRPNLPNVIYSSKLGAVNL
jgi:hypothetical protein